MRFRNFFRNLTASVVASVVLTSPVVAQRVEYQGGGFLTNFTAPCAVDGWSGTVQVIARARPAGEQGNHPTDHILNMFVNNYVMHFRLPAGPLDRGEVATATSFAQIGGGFGSNPELMPRVRELPEPANTVFSEENEAHIILEVLDFAGLAGCSFRANLWMHRR